MDQAKLDFLVNEYVPKLKDVPADSKGYWGKMNAQQTVEHVTGFFMVSTEKIKFPLVTPVEHLPKYKEFLMSDKEFRENTMAPGNIVPDEPVAVRNASMTEALAALQSSINDFVNYFKDDPTKKTMHPVFGELNFEEWILLHYKHVTHHLRQFALM